MKVEKLIFRINKLMDRLVAGEDVSLRSLARVLTPEQMNELHVSWEAEKSSRRTPKPSEILKYESFLRRGLLSYGKYEANRHKLSGYYSQKMELKAHSEFEKALEYANEIVNSNSSLRLWFDRDPSDAEFGAPGGMPRIVTSKSYDNECRGQKSPLTSSKRDLKLAALAAALDELQGNDLTALVTERHIWPTSAERPIRDFTGWKF